MTPPQPNLITVDSCSILVNRHKKIIKLEIMKEKSLAKKKSEAQKKQDITEEQNILPLIEDSKFSEIQSDKDESSCSSYDSSVHDLYDYDQIDEIKEEMQENGRGQSILNTKSFRDSYLIIDFRRAIKADNEGEKLLLQLRPKLAPQQNNKKSEKKTESFMEYYNSISKKSNSNILQKYIKTKR